MNFKVSKYIIVSEVNSQYLIFSTRTAKTIILNESIYNQFYIQQDLKNINSDLLQNLINNEFIIPDFEDELYEIITQNKEKIEENTTLYQVIQPSANCLLGCGYCGQTHTKGDFQLDLHEKLIERLRSKLIKNPKLNNIGIGWFGAEALLGLKSIKKLSVKLINLANDFNIPYGAKLVTNGLSLKKDIFLDLIKNYKINQFEITLDGTQEYHDRRRHLKNGQGSFNLIMKNLKDIFEIENFFDLNAQITIRCNVDSNNYKDVMPLIDLLKPYNKKITAFYVAPIHSWGNDAHLKSLNKEEFANLEIDWLLYLIQNDFNISLLPNRRYETCFAVIPDGELIDTKGNLYNCSEVSQVEIYENSEYVLGNLNDKPADFVFKNRPLENWNDTILENNELPCHSCKMLPTCSGACPKSWKEGIIACPTPKFNIEDRLALSYLAEKKGIDYIMKN
jgi:uncharacterized protein